MERRIRGSSLNGYLKFIKKKWGTSGMEQCMRDIGIDDMTFKDGHYYQDEVVGNVLRWVHREKGREAVVEAGGSILHNLGILSWLVRFANISTLAEKFPKNYSEVYTFGKCWVDTSDPKNITISFKGVGYYEEACLAWEGICKEALAMTKTKGRVTHTKCERLGDERCVFLVEL
ncbi:MAG: hypothetical protein KAT70_06965 [Thermoplasmata archaeon]|nr:hypothetical protein [Thermoplasmata archaeon]